jgi:hypothetical protein
MSDCARAYIELRDEVVSRAEKHLSKEHLKYFISIFESVINSKRRSNYINNFNGLITILENRGHVGKADVRPFERIVKQLPNCDILKARIYDYQCYWDRPYVNHGKLISTHSCDDLKRISKQFPKHVRFQSFSASVPRTERRIQGPSCRFATHMALQSYSVSRFRFNPQYTPIPFTRVSSLLMKHPQCQTLVPLFKAIACAG